MNKIQCDGIDFTFTRNHLPLLIHGKNKAGASLFTVTVVANLFSAGEKIVFLSGYPMAREEFFKQVSEVGSSRVLFFIQDEVVKFNEAISTLQDIQERVVVIKNVELFPEEIFNLASSFKKIIISGDINLCKHKETIMALPYNAKVFFSPFENTQLPTLEKYQGFLKSSSKTGSVTTVIT